MKQYMGCLAVEITRRCNMNCKFCAKGQAQNIDITTDIIDKTLNEMKKGVYINTLRITGGEPLLRPDLIVYLLNSIMEKKIIINNVGIFTNGLIKPNEEFTQAVKKFLNYQRQIESTGNNSALIRWSNRNSEKNYEGKSDTKFDIIISDVERQTSKADREKINATLSILKNEIEDKDFQVILQSDYYKSFGILVLEGNARENYKELIGEEVTIESIRAIDNNYFFTSLTDKPNTYKQSFLQGLNFVYKTLTVSANGNVFPGCMLPYERVDQSPMFNIANCNGDFFERVNNFCWEHSVIDKAANFRGKFRAVEFCKNHKVKIKYFDKIMSDYDFEEAKLQNQLTYNCEDFTRSIHKRFPKLDFFSATAVANALLVARLFQINAPKKIIQEYLKNCTYYDEDTIAEISPDLCDKVVYQFIGLNDVADLARKLS